AGGHDVGQRLRPGHRLDHAGRGVAEAEHPVAARVVQHRALEGDDPGTAGGQGDVRVDRVVRVEVDEACLHAGNLLPLVQVQQLGELVLDPPVLLDGGLRGQLQVGIAGEAGEGGVVEAGGQALAAEFAQRAQFG